jgi:CrcB protein
MAERFMSCFWIFLGGGLGSLARFGVSGMAARWWGETFPWGTIVANVSGSFIIGMLGALVSPEGRLDSPSRAWVTQFLMIGVCGGYTTFSSFSLQTLNLMRDREWLYAGGNVLWSVALCLIAVWLGYLFGSGLNSPKGH